jgi:predicted small secreted protein
VNLSSTKWSLEKMIKKILLIIVLIVMAFSIIGCQTVQGVGGDIKWTGQKTAEILEGK